MLLKKGRRPLSPYPTPLTLATRSWARAEAKEAEGKDSSSNSEVLADSGPNLGEVPKLEFKQMTILRLALKGQKHAEGKDENPQDTCSVGGPGGERAREVIA